jgi:hypothetical protein
MFVLLAKNAESAEEVHASCVIPPNTYAFVSMDIGMMGRYSSVCGLDPVILFNNNTDHNYYLFFQKIKSDGVDKKFRITWSIDDKLTKDDGQKDYSFDLNERVGQLKDERKYDAFNATPVELNNVTCVSIPIYVVEKEVYSFNIYQSKSLDELKKLPISPLYILYKWGATNLKDVETINK